MRPQKVVGLILLSLSLSGSFVAPARAQLDLTGAWSDSFNLKSRCVHATLLRGVNGNHSRIVWWPEPTNHNHSSEVHKAYYWDWNPSSPPGFPPTIPPSFHVSTNALCAGHSVLANGDLFITGGTELGDIGIRETALLKSGDTHWSAGALMAYPRWYPTNTTLPDGNVFISAGYTEPSSFVIGGQQGESTLGSTSLLRMRRDYGWQTPALGGTSPGARTLFSFIDLGQSWRTDGCSDDANRFVTLVYGGLGSGSTPLSDLWGLRWDRESDEYAWAALASPEVGGTWPPALSRHSAVYDTLGRAMLIYGGLQNGGAISNVLYRLNNIHVKNTDCTATMSWSTVTPTVAPGSTAPPGLYGHNALYDAKHRRMIVFGGRSAGEYSNDVWLLDLSTTTPTWRGPLARVGSEAPEGRAGAAAVWDTTRHISNMPYVNNRLLLFGGFAGSEPSLTLVPGTLWSGTINEGVTPTITWRALPPEHSDNICIQAQTAVRLNNLPSGVPVARADAAMVFEGDPYNRVVLYGGDTTPGEMGGELGDLWELELGPATCNLGYLAWVPKSGVAGSAPGARAGHAFVFDTRPRTALFPELYNATLKTVTTVANGKQWLYSYPFMHLLPSGELFYSGVDTRTRVFNFSTGWAAEPLYSGFWGDTGVLVPTSRGAQVFKCGQKVEPWGVDNALARRVGAIEFTSGGTTGWSEEPELPSHRQDGNVTILADGQVLLSGGVENDFEDSSTKQGRKKPLIWDPELKGWNTHDEARDQQILADAPVVRDYHSIALLLPDGSVFTAGGEDTTAFSNGTARRESGEIFYPPYLYKGNAPGIRPEILAIDPIASYGERFCLVVNGTAPVIRVTMVRPGSVTHGFDQDQRFVSVAIESTAVVNSSRQVFVGVPENRNLAPPGNYLVFAFRDSTPSIASWILLGQAQSGTLTESATWSPEQGPHLLTGDVIVPEGKSLTILPGTGVYSGTTASAAIRVHGTLYAQGTSTSPIKLGGYSSVNPLGGWRGVIVESGGTLFLNHAHVSNATRGVHIPAYLSTLIRITNCEFRDNVQQDIRIVRDPSVEPLTPAPITISGCSLTVGSGNQSVIGVELVGPMHNAVVSGNVFQGVGMTGGSWSGIEFNHSGGASTPLVEGNTFTGFSVGQGLKLGGGAAMVYGNTFLASKYGVVITGGTHQIASSFSTQMGNTFSGMGATGAQITGGSPIFRRNVFTACFNGVVSYPGATPEFGTASDHGQNSFINTTNKCLWNRSTVTVAARGNFWGNACQDSTEIPTCVVNVDYFPVLCTSPFASTRHRVEVEQVVSPRPAPLVSLTGTVVTAKAEFSVTHSETEHWTELRVYDVLGRLRSLIPLSGQREGSEEIAWRPVDQSGARLPSGLYFGTVRSRTSESRGVRILVLRSGGER